MLRLSLATAVALLAASPLSNIAHATALFYIATVSASSTGTDTGIAFAAGKTVHVFSAGYVTVVSDQPMVRKPTVDFNRGYYSPAGLGQAPGDATLPSCNLGAVIGTIAGSGVYHCLGVMGSFTAEVSGDLVLLINDDSYGDNLGSFDALIQKP